jgi:hypothetical protein
MTTAPTAEPQFCHGAYQALKLSNCVVISATGVHMSSGYTVFFKKSPLDVFPPEFSLMHIFEGGMLDVIVPFSIATSFETKDEIKEVIVWDADGEHRVAVGSFAKEAEAHAKQYYSKDGPFPIRYTVTPLHKTSTI